MVDEQIVEVDARVPDVYYSGLKVSCNRIFERMEFERTAAIARQLHGPIAHLLKRFVTHDVKIWEAVRQNISILSDDFGRSFAIPVATIAELTAAEEITFRFYCLQTQQRIDKVSTVFSCRADITLSSVPSKTSTLVVHTECPE